MPNRDSHTDIIWAVTLSLVLLGLGSALILDVGGVRKIFHDCEEEDHATDL